MLQKTAKNRQLSKFLKKMKMQNIFLDYYNNRYFDYFWRGKKKEEISKKCKTIEALIVTNIYQTTFKKSLENRKWSKGQMFRMEQCYQ